ncbi:recombinase family protein [Bdellovibrionota bacterium FG-2]
MDWKGKNNRAIGILRVSSNRQKDNTSHDVQRHEVQEYCQFNGLELTKVFEIVESAKDFEDRKKYRSAMLFAAEKGIQHVLFYMFDREARNLTDNEENEKLVRLGQIVLHYVRERKILHKESPDSDFLMRDFHAIQNKNYSRALSVKVNDSMKRKAEEGWYPSNRPPLGYICKALLNEEGRERRRGKIIVPDPNMQKREQVIREFELRATGLSFEEIRKRVIADGLIRPEKIKNYHATGIEGRIKNPFYRGQFLWQGQVHKGKHEIIIPNDIIRRVDATLYKKNFSRRPEGGQAVLAGGWLICGDPACGCNIVHELKTKRPKTGAPKLFNYLHCTNGKKIHPNLKGMHVTEEKIWNQLEGALDAISISKEFAAEISEAMNKAQRKTQDATKREMAQYRDALVALESEEDQLYGDLKKGVIAELAYHRLLKRVRDQRLHFSNLLEGASLAISDAGMETVKSILELATSAKSLWIDRSPQERRDFLDDILSNPVLDGTTVRYEIKKPFRIISEMAKSNVWRTQEGSNL